jgi:predicted  nucleic acid-binding Zn-ribbon protein
MALFRNFYRCDRCGHEWVDVWSATCDDDCPQCGCRHMSPLKSEATATQAELNRQAVARAQQVIDYYRGAWLCEEEGEAVLSLIADMYQWALSHGRSTEELRDTAYGNFLHDEAIEQEEAEHKSSPL